MGHWTRKQNPGVCLHVLIFLFSPELCVKGKYNPRLVVCLLAQWEVVREEWRKTLFLYFL